MSKFPGEYIDGTVNILKTGHPKFLHRKDNSELIKPIFKTLEEPVKLIRMMLALPVLPENNVGTVPFGYEKIITTKKDVILFPVELEFKYLVEAKEQLLKFSLREVANWLHAKTGTTISHFGLQKIMYTRRPVDECATKTLDEREQMFIELITKNYDRFNDIE